LFCKFDINFVAISYWLLIIEADLTTTMGKESIIPKKMRLKETAERLEFEYVWSKPKYLISIISTPIFSFFLIQSDLITGNLANLTIQVFILIVFSFIVIYYSLAKLVNTTKIYVTHEALDVEHGPVPFGKHKHLRKENVTQLYVTQHRIGHRYYLYSTTYQINVILKSKEVITLVKGLHTAEQGRFIENKIEDFLSIRDIYVEGELAKQ
jgi:hypothetical protein